MFIYLFFGKFSDISNPKTFFNIRLTRKKKLNDIAYQPHLCRNIQRIRHKSSDKLKEWGLDVATGRGREAPMGK